MPWHHDAAAETRIGLLEGDWDRETVRCWRLGSFAFVMARHACLLPLCKNNRAAPIPAFSPWAAESGLSILPPGYLW